MRAICVDDEALVLRLTLSLCREQPGLTEVEGFTDARAALSWLREHPADLALLDLDMPGIPGPELAFRVKELCPDASILFITGYRQLAGGDAAAGAPGYLLKPLSREKLSAELEAALSPRPAVEPSASVAVRCFGEFAVFADGRELAFPRAEAKELLARLVDRQGVVASRRALAAALWGGAFDLGERRRLDAAVRSLRGTLEEYGIGEILQVKLDGLRVRPELLDCDLYRAVGGEVAAINAYRGAYLRPYAWASLDKAYRARPQAR